MVKWTVEVEELLGTHYKQDKKGQQRSNEWLPGIHEKSIEITFMSSGSNMEEEYNFFINNNQFLNYLI